MYEAVAACKKLGLEVLDVYRPGAFLHCRWPKGALTTEVLEKLAREPSIRWVEPNFKVELPPLPGKQPAPPPGREGTGGKR